MIRLDSTTRKLQAILAGAVTTNQLPIVVCYSDKTATTYNGGTSVINTNSGTAIDICAAPAASTVRDIDTIDIQNADTAAATLTVRYNDNGTTYTLFKAVLAVGDQVTYVHGQGWKVLDSTGATKVLSGEIVTLSGAQTLTNKTFALGSNTLSGTFAQFNTACTDADFARTNAANTFTGVQTMTSPAITTPAFTGAFSGTYSLGGTPTINVAAAVGGTWTAASTWTLPALTLGGNVSSTGNPSLNIGTGALTAGAGTFSGNVTLGDASTDTVTVNGYMRVGGATPNASIGIFLTNSVAGATSYGVSSRPVGTSTNTTALSAYDAYPNTSESAYTLADLISYNVRNVTKGAGSTITNYHGLYIPELTAGTNNYGITSIVPAGTNMWNIYASGTAANYFAGTVKTGTTISVGAATPAASGAGITFPATQSASSDANTLDDYREATFTATATGMTTSPTGTATFVRVGNKITLDIPTISGTSNAVTFTLTGMPTTCRPSATRTAPVRVQDNTGSITWGMAQIDSAGVITLYKDAASGAFTASGTKSINTCSVAYVI